MRNCSQHLLQNQLATLHRGVMGVLQALEAVKVITGLGETMVGRCTLKPRDCHSLKERGFKTR
jgi:hypothetical protein